MSNAPKLLSDALADGPFSSWSDEQWSQHEAGLAANLAAKSSSDFTPTHAIPSRRRSLEELGWPVRALDAAASPDLTKPAIEKLSTWNSDERNVVVLNGPPGTGKTVGAAHWVLPRRERFQFVRAATFAASSRYNAEQRERWYDAPGLCLDDLGAEYLDAKGSFLVDLDELVDTYYADRRPLLITTNCTMAEFKARYGARVEDRIRECAVWLTIGGPSLRRSQP